MEKILAFFAVPIAVLLFAFDVFSAAPRPLVEQVATEKDGAVVLRVAPEMAKLCADPAQGGCVLVTQKQVYEVIKQTTHALCGKDV